MANTKSVHPFAAVVLGACLLAPSLVRADTSAGDQAPGAAGSSFWSVAFLGGAIAPLGAMDTDYQQGLAASLRIGWTSRLGLGVDFGLDYSPLAHRVVDPLEKFEVHYGTATLTPRFTMGKNVARMWIAGGGGVSFERTRRTLRDVPESNNATALVATGAAGVELHLVSGGGLVVVGSYSKLFGDLSHQYAEVLGGLVFTFR